MTDDTPLRVSFLDEQTVQSSNTTFNTQLSYTFDHWDGELYLFSIFFLSQAGLTSYA